MRTLAKHEHEALRRFLDEIDEKMTAARRTVDRARNGSELDTHVELDFTRSSIADITEVAELVEGYLARLVKSTSASKGGTPKHGFGQGLVPPSRSVYTIDDDAADDTADEGARTEAEVAA